MKKIMVILITSLAVVFNTAMGQYDHERQYNLDQIFFHSEFERKTVINYLEGNYRDQLDLLLASGKTINQQNVKEYKQIFEEFTSDLKHKQQRYKKQHKFLEYLFFKVHRKFLKHYQNYVTIENLFKNKYYDCVIGSSFYALVLDRLGISYHIIETNYHMFIMLEMDETPYLFESTDPIAGFVHGIDKVMERLERIKKRERTIEQENSNSAIFTYKYVIHKNINLEELVGLQYFNLATVAFNEANFEEAINCVQKGRLFYDSQRMKEMMRLIVHNYQNMAKNVE
jgi:hypothetical protein